MSEIYDALTNSQQVINLLGPDLFLLKLWAGFVLVSYLIFPESKGGAK